MFKKVITIAALAIAAVGGAAGAAKASTPGCTAGTFSGYCGTQTDQETAPLSWDVYQQRASYDNKVIGYTNSPADPATDLFFLKYQGGNSDFAEYMPDGRPSGMCVSQPFQGAGLVLRPCNGSPWQLFTPAEAAAGFTWTDKATGQLVTVTGLRGQLTGEAVPAAPMLPTTSQEFTFSG